MLFPDQETRISPGAIDMIDIAIQKYKDKLIEIAVKCAKTRGSNRIEPGDIDEALSHFTPIDS